MADDKKNPPAKGGDDKDDELGEAGKKALDSERANRKAAEQKVKDLEKEGFATAGFSCPYGKKLRPAFQPPDSISLCISRRHAPVGQFGR